MLASKLEDIIKMREIRGMTETLQTVCTIPPSVQTDAPQLFLQHFLSASQSLSYKHSDSKQFTVSSPGNTSALPKKFKRLSRLAVLICIAGQIPVFDKMPEKITMRRSQ